MRYTTVHSPYCQRHRAVRGAFWRPPRTRALIQHAVIPSLVIPPVEHGALFDSDCIIFCYILLHERVIAELTVFRPLVFLLRVSR